MRCITVAEYAGFCFGVKRATDRLEQALRSARSGERICTLGHLIHNETYNDSLRRRGVLRATVDKKKIRLIAELFISRQHTAEAALNGFKHGAVIVLVLHGLHAKFPVGLFQRLSIHMDGHRGNYTVIAKV